MVKDRRFDEGLGEQAQGHNHIRRLVVEAGVLKGPHSTAPEGLPKVTAGPRV